MNLMTVLQYAIDTLGIKQVIVCGHYNCGGIKHAIGSQYAGLINKWLTNVKVPDLIFTHF
jgi:carbonic anhydrase